jgi:hypothetical protein
MPAGERQSDEPIIIRGSRIVAPGQVLTDCNEHSSAGRARSAIGAPEARDELISADRGGSVAFPFAETQSGASQCAGDAHRSGDQSASLRSLRQCRAHDS